MSIKRRVNATQRAQNPMLARRVFYTDRVGGLAVVFEFGGECGLIQVLNFEFRCFEPFPRPKSGGYRFYFTYCPWISRPNLPGPGVGISRAFALFLLLVGGFKLLANFLWGV